MPNSAEHTAKSILISWKKYNDKHGEEINSFYIDKKL